MVFKLWKIATAAALLLGVPAIGYGMSVFYSYDPANRLATTKEGVNASSCQIYSYDAAGNILSSRTDATGTATNSTWGTGSWGCLNWSSVGKRQ